MAEWQTVRLSKIVSTNQSTYSPKEDWQFANYLDTGNITMNQIDEIQYINTSADKLPSRARRKVKLNSIIYSTVRPNQLHYGIIKKQPENFLVSTGFVVIDVDFGYRRYPVNELPSAGFHTFPTNLHPVHNLYDDNCHNNSLHYLK